MNAHEMQAAAGRHVWLKDIWSNFDHVIDREVAERLKQGDCFAPQPAWDYYGVVWFEDGQYHEQIWVYGSLNETVSAATIDDLKLAVTDEYGTK